MKLYMKQKVFSFKDKFTIKDSNGEDKYYVEGELISLGKKLHIYDMQGNELAFVRQKIVSFLPKFTIEVDGREIAQIVKKISFLKPKYIVDGLGWNVEGNFLAHDYVINDGAKDIVLIHKKYMAWGDSFELCIAEEQNEVISLAVVLAIDAVMDSNNQ